MMLRTGWTWSLIIAAPSLAIACLGCDSSPACDGQEEQRARQVLETYCYRCHGQTEPLTAGLDVSDAAAMSARKSIVAGDPDGSLLYQRIAGGEMPPAGEEPRPGPEDVEAVKRWLACGIDGQPRPATHVVSIEAMLHAMRLDIEKVSESRRQHTRYFVLTHLANAGATSIELENHRRGLFKLLNSLSWGPEPVTPTPVDIEKTIYRIYLPDYRWEPQATGTPSGDLWERMLQSYPYGLLHLTSEDASILADESSTSLPWVHGDWFVNEASAPPLYYDMLRLPKDIVSLEALVGVSSAANIQNATVLRAGFSQSSVSQNNRVIERHSSSHGPYWKSYDFSSSTGAQNIFENPLGPATVPLGAFQFKPAGGEAIFTLPDGFHGYLIVNAAGARIDAAPTSIVVDKQQQDSTVRSGRSCMSCHREGIVLESDEVRAFYDNPPGGVPQVVLETIRDLYPPAADFEKAQLHDRALYRAALDTAGIPATGSEPVGALANAFDGALDLRRAAAELWVSEVELENTYSAITLLPPLGNAGGATVKREVFEDAFAQVVCELNHFTPMVNGDKLGCP